MLQRHQQESEKTTQWMGENANHMSDNGFASGIYKEHLNKKTTQFRSGQMISIDQRRYTNGQ